MRWIFLLLPWLELFSLIQLGRQIGGLATLAYVFVTLMLGMALLRRQGGEIFNSVRQAEAGHFVPQRLIASELALGFAGLLLIIPGLITDSLAVLVVVGVSFKRLSRGSEPEIRSHEPNSSGGQTLDGEYRRIDD